MILIFAGHNPSSPGVCYPKDNPNWCEHVVASGWVNRIALKIRQRVEVVIGPTGGLTHKVNWVNQMCKYNKVDLAVELHFNGDESGKAHGSETLYCPGSVRGELMANIVQGAVGSVLKPDRGVKPGWYRMILPPNPEAVPNYFLSHTKCPALIIEPEFMYNRAVIETNRDFVCDIIADALVECATNA